jgi:hypothetical protein
MPPVCALKDGPICTRLEHLKVLYSDCRVADCSQKGVECFGPCVCRLLKGLEAFIKIGGGQPGGSWARHAEVKFSDPTKPVPDFLSSRLIPGPSQ